MRPILLLVSVIAILALAPATFGASPLPTEEATDPRFEIWIDEPLPPDVPEGRTVPIGFTVWDSQSASIFQVSPVFVRVHPKAGKAPPTETQGESDWPGHVTADIKIPKGGLGTIVAGTESDECVNGSGCKTVFQPMKTAGYGPPPEASRAALVSAAVDRIPSPAKAGKAFTVSVSLTPLGAWGIDDMKMPDRLVAAVRIGRGEVVKSDLPQVGQDLRYSGQITVTDGGDAMLTVGVPTADGNEDPLSGTTASFHVDGPVASASAAPTQADAGTPAPPSGSGALPIVPIAIVAVVIVGGVLFYRFFGDL